MPRLVPLPAESRFLPSTQTLTFLRSFLVFQPAIIIKARQNTSTFSTAGRAMTTVGHIPLGVGKSVGKGAFSASLSHRRASTSDSVADQISPLNLSRRGSYWSRSGRRSGRIARRTRSRRWCRLCWEGRRHCWWLRWEEAWLQSEKKQHWRGYR
jgi:hypothetical protein